MQKLIVYGPDGKTPIDPTTLPQDAQDEIRKFAKMCSKSFLFKESKDGPPPAWATPIRSTKPVVVAAVGHPDSRHAQAALFALEAAEPKSKKRQVRSVAE